MSAMNIRTEIPKNFENNENVIMNSCDKWRKKDVKNCSGSEDMFSDDEQMRGSAFNSPKISLKNETLDSPSVLLKTPILFSKVSEETPGRAVIPRTPVGLLPLINKTDILWTSDMETPESKFKQKFLSYEKVDNPTEWNIASRLELCSPPNIIKEEDIDMMSNTSPVLGSKKRPKKKAKRRLLNHAVLDLDNIDQQSSISSNSDRVPSDIASTVSNDVDFETEIHKIVEEEMLNVQPVDLESNENKKLEEVVTARNVNTSTQEFFSNASFSSIDKLCFDVIHEQTSSNVEQIKNTETASIIKKELKIETNLENDDIEKRVAAIKRNQKSIRRSSDINHTVIPKELFSKSVRDLELADAHFSQEKKLQPATLNKFEKSFIPLSSLENQAEKNFPEVCSKNTSNVKNEEIETWFDDWNTNTSNNKIIKNNFSNIITNPTCKNNFNDSAIKKEVVESCDNKFEPVDHLESIDVNNIDGLCHIKNEMISNKMCNSIELNNFQDGFSTASGKNVIINEEKLRSYSKIYSEMEAENIDEDSIIKLKNKARPKNLEINVQKKNNFLKKPTESVFEKSRQTHSLDLKNPVKKLGINSIKDSNSTSMIMDCQISSEFSDGFSTAKGKSIIVNEEKENYYSKVYNELDDNNEDNFVSIKKNRVSRLSLKKPLEKPLVKFNKNETITNQTSVIAGPSTKIKNNLINDGFSTARGNNIKINESKESYYSKIYDELGNCDENSLFEIKKNKTSKLSLNQKSTDKPLVKFNKEIKTKNEAFKDIPVTEVTKTLNKIKVEPTENLLTNTITEEIFCNSEDFDDIVIIGEQNKKLLPQNYNKPIPSIASDLKQTNTNNLIQKNIPCTEKILIKQEKTCENTEQFKNPSTIERVCKKEKISQIDSLKRKLEACEVKRPERSRSFGGFPADEDIPTSKLNKSDPEEVFNQPLVKNSSFSQFFDPHSDSWLSKIEISHLNESKNKSPGLKEKEDKNNTFPVSEDEEDFLGFSSAECVESFRCYAKIKKVFMNLKDKYSELNIEAGNKISIFNNTSLRQKLYVQFDNNLSLKNDKKLDYELIESEPKPTTTKDKLKNDQSKVKNKIEPKHRAVEKRKHAEIESDTPLTTLKKPRVGSELQGRKLFSEESDSEESNYNFGTELMMIDDTQPMTISPLEDLSEERISATLEQEKIIKNKKRLKVPQIIGNLLSERLKNHENRLSWADVVGSAVPKPCNINQIRKNHPDAKVIEVTASNAVEYKFVSYNIINNKNVVSISIGDNASLIFDENGNAGLDEFSRAFLAMPGVDPKLVPNGWIENHYKWIVWKLACIDRMAFNSTQLPKMLTPDRVMKELKYRYDREIDRAQRPALRKILEKDDVPSRRLVLCISSIKESTMVDDEDRELKTKLGLSRWKVEASDGWYSIPLTIDIPMENFITTGKLKEGTKIITYGAELLNCDRGFFPLDKPDNVSLKIHTNCTRRARWDTKLGYQQSSRPIPVKLNSILLSGGMIGETTAAAARLYPLLFREKTADGQSIYRNARSEEKAAMAYERARESKVDAIYAEAERNFHSKKKAKSDEDAENTQEKENNRQRIKDKVELEVRDGLPPPRQVTPVLKCRLVDDKTTVILTIWGANEDSSFDIKEGDTLTLYNCFSMGMRGGDLNITANRVSHIKKETLFKIPCPTRTCTLLSEIATADFAPKFYEFDTVGVVVSSGPAPYGMKNFEVVNLAYPRSSDTGSTYLSILFWNGISSFGYQKMFTAGSLVACSNLEWRRNTSWTVPVAYCSEKSVFTCNPRQPYLMKELRDLKTLVQNPISYAESCVEEVNSELSKRPLPKSNQATPTASTSFLLNSSTASVMSPADIYSPSNASIQRRMEKLSRYGSTADMSPIVLNSSSGRVKKDFTPVTRPKS